jgi:dihydroorotate dehydrogenase electron transfer subunit
MQAEVQNNESLSPGYYRLTLHCPALARDVQPGQFVMLRVNEGPDPLLRRPFSIHQGDGERVQILYQVVGKGTRLMAELPPGQTVDLLGPLGNGFHLPPGSRQAMLIGGGVGVAPLLFWAQKLAHKRIGLLVFIGGKSSTDLLAVEDFRRLEAEIYLATEDGSQGRTGKVTTIAEDYLRRESSTRAVAMFACGPKAMLARIADLARRHRLPCQLSLDVVMACGVGACGGCVVKTRGSEEEVFNYSRVCREGPVFEAARIIWK